MPKYVCKDRDGVIKEVLELEVLDKGKHVGWVPVEIAVDFHSGKLSEDELKYEAQKQAMPTGKQESWNKKLYILEDED